MRALPLLLQSQSAPRHESRRSTCSVAASLLLLLLIQLHPASCFQSIRVVSPSSPLLQQHVHVIHAVRSPNVEEEASAVTLYDILGASPDDSRADLKRRYVQLAKQTHPDALLQNNHNSTESSNGSHHSFQDIAQAYRVLSDKKQRQRYDRELKAAALTEGISKFASDVSEAAAPQVRDMLDTFAVPFIRRTTATTLASIQAAARDLQQKREAKKKQQNMVKNNGTGTGGSSNSTMASSPSNSTTTSTTTNDLGEVFVSAMKAAQKAGRIVENLELMEQSEALETKLQDQLAQAQELKAELDTTTLQRVQTAVQTPNATISTQDAWTLVQHWKQEQHQEMNNNNNPQQPSNHTSTTTTGSWNALLPPLEQKIQDWPSQQPQNSTASPSTHTRTNHKKFHPLERKIQNWQRLEQQLDDATLNVQHLYASYNASEQALQQARADKVLALQAQKRARESLARARRQVAQTNTQVTAATKALARAAVALEGTAQQHGKLQTKYTRQETVVRLALLKKQMKKTKNGVSNQKVNGETVKVNGETTAARNRVNGEAATNSNNDDVVETASPVAAAELSNLQEKERQLKRDYKKLAIVATRLQAQANKLKEKAAQQQQVKQEQEATATTATTERP